jgi:Holliday junction resolvase RusA-like endonuclease
LLTGVVWEDDSQIFDLRAVKLHGSESGIGVRVWLLDGSPGEPADEV